MVDVRPEREAYSSGIVEDFICNRRKYNLEYAMTKASILPQCIDVTEPGKIEYEIKQYVKDNYIDQNLRKAVIRQTIKNKTSNEKTNEMKNGLKFTYESLSKTHIINQ